MSKEKSEQVLLTLPKSTLKGLEDLRMKTILEENKVISLQEIVRRILAKHVERQ